LLIIFLAFSRYNSQGIDIRAVGAVVMGEDPVMGVLLEYMQPGFEMEKYFNMHGDRFMINLGPQGLNLALRNPKDVRSDLSHPHVKGSSCPCSFIAAVEPGGGPGLCMHPCCLACACKV
jgi:hypothetical protein